MVIIPFSISPHPGMLANSLKAFTVLSTYLLLFWYQSDLCQKKKENKKKEKDLIQMA